MKTETTATSETPAPSLLAGEDAPPAAPETDGTGATDTAAPKTDEQGANASADGEGGEPKGDAKDGGDAAPELELKVPEGFEVDDAALGELKDLAREAGLKPEQAQKLVDMHVGSQKALIERADAAIAKQAQEWQAAVKADKEVGGADFATNLQQAKTALTRFGTPELVEALNASGLGNHPEMVRLLVRVGKASAEDSSAGKHSGGAASARKTLEQALYPDLS